MSVTRRAPAAPLSANVLLQTLAGVPLVSALDLATITGTGAASVRRRLRGATTAGLVGWVTPHSDRLLPRRLSYLTATGLHAAARAVGQDAVAYARAHDLGEAALLGRLARLEHLALTRAVLLDLLRALPTVEPGATVRAWRPWPLALPAPHAGAAASGQVVVDGAAVLRRARGGVTGVSAVVLLWDNGQGDPAGLLRPRLAGLLRARAAWRGLDPARQAGFPTVLLLSPAPARARAALLQADLMARAAGDTPLALLTCGDADRALASTLGPLDPALLWHTQAGAAQPLLASLPLLASPGAWTLVDASGDGRQPGAVIPARRGALPHGGYARQAREAWAHTGAHGRTDEVSETTTVTLLSLGLPLAARAIVRLVAHAPFLNAHQIAVLLDEDDRRIRALLRALCAHDLCRRFPVGPLLVPGRDVVVLTWRGLRLLAGQAGLSPRSYRQATGALATPRRPVQAGGRVAGLDRLSAHTRLIQEIQVAWTCATRHGKHGGGLELAWRGEWACAQRFWGEGAWRVLYPDALVRLSGAGVGETFLLEVDRGTYAARHLATKLAGYQAYRASGAWQAVAPTFPTVLVITSGEGRLRALLEANTGVADAALTTPLPLLVATLEDARAHGPLGAIWRCSPLMPPGLLLEQVRLLSDRGPLAAQGPVVGGSAPRPGARDTGEERVMKEET